MAWPWHNADGTRCVVPSPMTSECGPADQAVVLRNMPLLINAMIEAYVRKTQILKYRATVERVAVREERTLPPVLQMMRLCQMIVQATWCADYQHPLMQLPHMEPRLIRHLSSKRSTATVAQLAQLTDADRRYACRAATCRGAEGAWRIRAAHAWCPVSHSDPGCA